MIEQKSKTSKISELNNENTHAKHSFRDELKDMFDLTIEMLSLAHQGFKKSNYDKLSESLNYGKRIHEKEKLLTNNLVIILTKNKELFQDLQGIDFVPSHLERIGDNIELLIRCTTKIIDEGICFSDKAINEINTLFELTKEIIIIARDASINQNEFLINHMNEETRKFQHMVSEFSQWHYDRLIEGICTPKSSSLYIAILDYLSEILKHLRFISERISSQK